MSTQPLTAPRPSKRFKTSPLSAGLPDPRPLTTYEAVYTEVSGKSRVTVTLDQPCIIRHPDWSFVDCADGTQIKADSFKPLDHATIQFDFKGIIAPSVAFIDVPYQDIQVQNFQGGFVQPGGTWFRNPA